MAIGLSHGGSTIYASAAPSTRLLVGTADGVVTLERDGSRWRVGGRALAARHVSAIVLPAPDLVVAAAFEDTVHVSEDGGTTWAERGRGIAHRHVFSLAAVPRDGGVRLYAGTEPAHLYFSDDLGLHWTERAGLRAVPSVPRWWFPAPPKIAHVKHVVPDPLDPRSLYACIEQGALLRSRDEGETWEELSGYDEDVHVLTVHPSEPRRLRMTCGIGFYSSDDGGTTWKRHTDQSSPVGGYPDLLVVHPRQSDLLFMSAGGSEPGAWRRTHRADARVSKSRDGGRTWDVLTRGISDRLAGSIEAMCLEDWGASFSVFVATTEGEVYASEDGGESWSQIASGLPAITKWGHDRALMGL